MLDRKGVITLWMLLPAEDIDKKLFVDTCYFSILGSENDINYRVKKCIKEVNSLNTTLFRGIKFSVILIVLKLFFDNLYNNAY